MIVTIESEWFRAHGWKAHEAVHEVFARSLRWMYAHLGQPLELAVQAALLQRSLRAHMHFEETQVLPCFATAVPDPPVPASVSNFLRDHEIVRTRLQELREVALRVHGGTALPLRLRQAIVNLDEVLEHHDQREAEYLYPLLQEALDPSAQERLLAGLAGTSLWEPLDLADCQALAGEPALALLAERYLCWRTGGSIPAAVALPPSALPALSAKARGALPSLLGRDQRLLAQLAGIDPAQLREWSHAEQRADVTLLSTEQFVIDGLLDQRLEGASPQR